MELFSITRSARRRFSDGRNRGLASGSYSSLVPPGQRSIDVSDAHYLRAAGSRNQQPAAAPAPMAPLPPVDPSARTRTTSSANFQESVRRNNRSNDMRALGHLSSLPPSADPLVNARRQGMILDKADRTGLLQPPAPPGEGVADSLNIADRARAYRQLRGEGISGGMTDQEARSYAFGEMTPSASPGAAQPQIGQGLQGLINGVNQMMEGIRPTAPAAQNGVAPPATQPNNPIDLTEQQARQMLNVSRRQNPQLKPDQMYPLFTDQMTRYGVNPDNSKAMWDKFMDSDHQFDYEVPGTGSPGGFPAGTPMARPVPGAPGVMEMNGGGIVPPLASGRPGAVIPGPQMNGNGAFLPPRSAYQPPEPPEMGPQPGYTPASSVQPTARTLPHDPRSPTQGTIQNLPDTGRDPNAPSPVNLSQPKAGRAWQNGQLREMPGTVTSADPFEGQQSPPRPVRTGTLPNGRRVTQYSDGSIR